MRANIIQRSLPLLSLLALGLACTFDPHPKSGVQACNRKDRSCPPGYVCVAAGTCWLPKDLAANSGDGGMASPIADGPQNTGPGGSTTGVDGSAVGDATALGGATGMDGGLVGGATALGGAAGVDAGVVGDATALGGAAGVGGGTVGGATAVGGSTGGGGGIAGGATAVGSNAGGTGGTSSSGASQCTQWTARLQGCQVISTGAQFACQEPGSDERCAINCLLNANCNDVRAVACGFDTISTPLTECVAACMTFLCNNGQTIDVSYACNGDRDCLDGSDEVGCLTFTCPNGNAIAVSELCDGVQDCLDGSDELGCSVFVCANGLTIPSSYRCDGSRDCLDGSDELGCPPPLASIAKCF